ncbi:MAG TPA: zinc-binding dehydrogenase [Propionibacterium sp.]|jgi:propanol-preferring alcohol dehydrogenase|nr:zinc-binding dehydrogenase [Propionibacterium sp.]
MTCTAWQFTGVNEPLVRNEVETPRPGANQVVLDIKAAGLCHTDVGVLTDEGWLSTLGYTPITMGHEVAGVISEVGENVTEWKVGDRVGVCPTTEIGAPGFLYDGGFGEQVTLDQVALVKIPDNVSFAQGAAGTDAGMTSHSAVITNGQVKAGDKVCIIGMGGLGQIGARVAVLAGAEVYIVDTNDAVVDLAKRLGAKDVKKSIKDYADIGFDCVVDFAGFDTTNAAIEAVRFGGRVVQVGMGKLEATISTKALILSNVTLIGSVGGTKDDVAGVYHYFSTGELEAAITEITFDEIPEGLDRLHKGGVVGRLVAVRD